MKRLISIEFQKIWLNKAGRILTISYFVLLSFIALIASIKFDIGTFKLHIAEWGIFNFPYIWHFNTYVAAFLKFFLAIVIVSMMANEYSYGTLKQNLIDGISKKEFILSKFLTVIVFAVASTVFVFVMTLILGFSFSSYTELGIVFMDLEFLFAYFIKLVAFFSFCLFVGIVIKRSAFALGFILIWAIGEAIGKAILTYEVFPKSPVAGYITQFFPLESMSNLIKEPITRLSVIRNLETTIGGSSELRDYDLHISSVLIVLVWTVFFVLMSYKLLKKRDL